jgi:hypothetical protein
MMTSRELFAYILGWYFSDVLSRKQHRENAEQASRIEGAGSETPTTQPHELHDAAPREPTNERKHLLNQYATLQKAPGEFTTDLHITAGKRETSEPMKDKSEEEQSKTPACIVDAGSVKANIWASQGKHGECHSITFVRVYKDKESGTEKTLHSFRPQDIERLVAAAEKAREHIATLSRPNDREQEHEIRISR